MFGLPNFQWQDMLIGVPRKAPEEERPFLPQAKDVLPHANGLEEAQLDHVRSLAANRLAIIRLPRAFMWRVP